MPALDHEAMTYYRDMLKRYGYRNEDFGLSLKPIRSSTDTTATTTDSELDGDLAIAVPPTAVQSSAAALTQSISITCRSTKVKRHYAADDDHNWVLNFEEDLGCGMYR